MNFTLTLEMVLLCIYLVFNRTKTLWYFENNSEDLLSQGLSDFLKALTNIFSKYTINALYIIQLYNYCIQLYIIQYTLMHWCPKSKKHLGRLKITTRFFSIEINDKKPNQTKIRRKWEEAQWLQEWV